MKPELSQMTPLELAEMATYDRSGWNNPYCEELCRRAGLHRKFQAARGDDVRIIVQRAAKSFGIKMI